LQRRFAVDVPQAVRVVHLATALYDGLVGPRMSTPEADARRELEWAANVHEIGMMISHHDHHRHSAYLMGHVDAPGFSQSQQRHLGLLLLAQRGGLRKVEAELPGALPATGHHHVSCPQ
jgi:exopolyphosphatase/guanosine-5'-triphosphate,3'-diphosphate pyrophosphatase